MSTVISALFVGLVVSVGLSTVDGLEWWVVGGTGIVVGAITGLLVYWRLGGTSEIVQAQGYPEAAKTLREDDRPDDDRPA
jgi:hypothetical protein